MINPKHRLTISSFPFNHFIIEEIFDAGTASGLSSTFNELIVAGRRVGKVGEVGELIYDAINFTPRLEHVTSTPISKLVSLELKEFVAELLDIRFDENLMIGMHRHLPPSKSGWSHTDFAVVSFPNIAPNYAGQRIYFDGCGCTYSDDSRDRQPKSIKTARAVACLYYSANRPWKPGMGGETGIYMTDGTTLVSAIPPKNNLLFVFEISPLSYRAYLGSQSMQRSSYIWWYHAPPSYLTKRHSGSVSGRTKRGLDPWDRWTEPSVAKYEFPLIQELDTP